eukprot:TRINITY_DN3391_c0_g1_i1.p1 TRINITY_DN3391_c0_g1~~TRINITY_DN3391_c0_g1_i1.p1  ORF type:complete len:893 (+),score=174.60 TRINITY_DN3391_c0_g1_i1:57-2681(+)
MPDEQVYEMTMKDAETRPVNIDGETKNVEEKEVHYKVLEKGEGKTRSHHEVSPWGAVVQDGQLISQHDPNVHSPYGNGNGHNQDKNNHETGSPFEADQENDSESESTCSTNTEDWLAEPKVHWEWNTQHIIISIALSIIVMVGIGLWAATSPAEPEGDEIPRNAHLLSTSASQPGFLDLGIGHPNKILETVVWVQPHGVHAPVQVNVTVEITLNKSDDSSWVRIDPDPSENPKMLTIVDSSDGKDHKFELNGPNDEVSYTRMAFVTDSHDPVSLAIHVIQMHEVAEYRVLFAALVLMFEYTLIVFELVDRTVAAMLGSFVALVVLGIVKERPDLHEVINWIDFETVLLLFGMMVMVRIFSLTGVFEYSAVKAYKASGGDLWKLTWILCTFTAVTSAFLDNVTTMLLLTPVTCRLCKILKLDPTPLLLAEVMFSNIGGTATAVGDPPNIIIVNDNEISSRGIEFAEFTLHMMIGSVFVFFATMPFMKWKLTEWLEKNGAAEVAPPQPEDELEREKLEANAKKQRKLNLRNSFRQDAAPEGVGGDLVNDLSYEEQERHTYARNHPKWNIIELQEEKDAITIGAFHVKVSVDHYKHNVNNDLLKRILIDNVQKMESEIRVSEISGAVQLERTFAQKDTEGFEEVVRKMEQNYKVKYFNMFLSVGIVLLVVIMFFFLHSATHEIHLTLAWISILGAIMALTVSGIDEPEKHVFSHVEWGTLLFFAALFVLMEALTELGLIDWLGDKISEMINAVDGETEQMVVAIISLIWVSAFASAFIDNIPYTTAMVPVVINVADSTGLSLKPMVFALAFGTCLGGNGTLIGASANVVTVGIAKEAYGNEISFVEFMKFGLPVMIVTIFVAMVYLIIAHPLIGWNM